MNRTHVILLLCIVTAAGILTSCVHQHQSTGLTYFLHTEYDVFNFEEHPSISPSNFIAFCTLPMEKQEDERGELLIRLIEHYLQQHGYLKISKDELLANEDLIPQTFLVGVGYTESFTYDTIQIEFNLYQINLQTKENEQFWSWKTKFDGYPISRDTVEPALKDIFVLEPIDYKRTETIFPRMSANTNSVRSFMEEIASARLNIIERIRTQTDSIKRSIPEYKK
jgi:hypothetical protein